MEYAFSISVIVVCYNSDYTDLMRTVYSVIRQKKIDFDIVVTDDGSAKDYFQELKSFFEQFNFSNYKFVKNKKNVGTVKNVLSGDAFTRGRYVKLISPGDFIYDIYTLRDIYEFMKKMMQRFLLEERHILQLKTIR